MRKRLKILTIVTAICLCLACYGVANHYFPYIFPEEKCFTKDGKYLSSATECNGSIAQIFEQAITPVEYSNAILPIGNEAHKLCLKLCIDANICSNFSVHPPAKYYDNNSTGGQGYSCSFYKTKVKN